MYHLTQLCKLPFYTKMGVDENFKLVFKKIEAAQKFCKKEEDKGTTVVITGAEVWNKAYKKRNDIDVAYEGLYTALIRAFETMNSLSTEIEDLKTKLKEQEEAPITLPKENIKEIVEDCLPGIIKDAVTIALGHQSVTKTYANALKKAVQETHEKVTEKATRTLDTSIEAALVKNQQEIIESTKSKTDAENYEKMRKSRNIVIRGIDESRSDDTLERIEHDTKTVEDLCGINRNDIIKIFRAGKIKQRENGDTDVRPRQRPIIVTMVTPEQAREIHKHGFGRKISESIWINQDLTSSERTAAWKARNARRSNVVKKQVYNK